MLAELNRISVDIVIWGGLAILVFGLSKLIYLPLAVAFELRDRGRRRRGHPTMLDERPTVSVIVPAYNEGPVLGNCVRSLLCSTYDRIDVIVVDDGSTDDTAAIMAELARANPTVTAISQANGGKGAALNQGIASATGDVLLFVDADGVFSPDTVSEMLRGFDHPNIGAVCGDDRPINLNRPQTHLLAVLNHAGTGLVRRALVVLGCLPIVSGNIGAFPRTVIDEVGGFNESTIGEDLELTWRIHRAGYQVAFQPHALVRAEAPSTLRNLWRQRVRWGRGLIQTMRIHRDMIGNPRYRTFGPYLVVNTLTMLVMPILQLLVLACVPLAFAAGRGPFTATLPSVLGWVGIWLALAVVMFSIGLNRAWGDLRFLWSVVLWPFYSTIMAAVAATSLWKEFRHEPAVWNKMRRTGIVSVSAFRDPGATITRTATHMTTQRPPGAHRRPAGAHRRPT